MLFQYEVYSSFFSAQSNIEPLDIYIELVAGGSTSNRLIIYLNDDE